MSSLKHYVLKKRSGWQSEENNETAFKKKQMIRTNKDVELNGGGGEMRAGI